MPFLFLLLLLAGCSTVKETASVLTPCETSFLDLSPYHRSTSSVPDAQTKIAALRFDAFLKSELGPLEEKQWDAQCRRKKHLFCLTPREKKKLRAYRDNRTARHEIPLERQIVPVGPVLLENQIQNWRALQRAKRPALVAGFSPLSIDTLRALIPQALAHRCPNLVAVSIGATLEDHLPNAEIAALLPPLYEKSAQCARREPTDREHFRTRAALIHVILGNYREAESLLKKVKATDALSGRAAYWLYRTRLALKDSAGAAAALKQLQGRHPFSFHSLISGPSALGAQLTRSDDTGLFKRRSTKIPRSAKTFEQIETLRGLGYADSAALLAEWALNAFRLEPQARLYLASLGNAHTQVIAAPDVLLRKPTLRSRRSFELAYPRPFAALFEDQAKRVSLDPFLLFALARKESSFDPKAVSMADARGLMQIQVATGKRMTGGSEPNLFDPQQNVSLGAKYLAQLMHENQGKVALALAAYNAGEDAVARWSKRMGSDDLILFIDLIPYRETRDYVAGVLANYYWYHSLYKAEPPEIFRNLVAKP